MATTSASVTEEVNVDRRSSAGGNNGRSNRLAAMLESGFGSDVIFIVGKEKKEFKAHKLILRFGSKVFDQLFSEAEEGQNSVEVPDLDPRGFSLLLKYLYSGDFPENCEDLLLLVTAAGKYKVPDLIEICEAQLSQNLNVETAINLFQLSIKCKDEYMEELALKYICSNGFKFMASESLAFLKLTTDEFARVLLRNDLKVTASELVRGVMKWAQGQTERSKRKLSTKPQQEFLCCNLEMAIHLLRVFPNMDPLAFFKLMHRAIVPAGDLNSIPTLYSPSGTQFTLPRLVRNLGVEVMNLTTRPNNGYCYCYVLATREEECIRFRCNLPIWVTSIGMNCTYPVFAEYFQDTLTVQVELKDAEKKIMATQNEVVVGVRGRSGSVYHIKMGAPVYLKANDWYIASFTVSDTFHGALYTALDGVGNSLDFKLPDGRKVTFEFKNEHSKHTDPAKGFIPEIGFMTD